MRDYLVEEESVTFESRGSQRVGGKCKRLPEVGDSEE